MKQVVNKRHFGAVYDVYIGRGSKWGNPFSHTSGTLALYRVKTRAESIQRYREWILTQIPLLEALLAGELDGKVLGCFCKPEACHGDVLVELRNNKELVALSLRDAQAKIAAQRSGRQPGESVLSTDGIGVNRKNTPAMVTRPVPPAPAPATIWTPQGEVSVKAEPAPPQATTAAPARPQRPKRPVPPGMRQEAVNDQALEAVRAQVDSFRSPVADIITTATQQGAQEVVNKLSSQQAYDNSAKAMGIPPRPSRPVPPGAPVKPAKLNPSQAEALLKGGHNVLAEPIPDGYIAVGKNDREALMYYKAQIILHQVMAFDYETNGDPDDDTTDPQDHYIVGVSFTWKLKFAVYLPIRHDNYGANWDWQELRSIFLKPLLEDPDILLIAHNIKAEYQWSLTHGIDFFHKALKHKVVDTMLMVKLLALPENTEFDGESYEVRVGLKPATKALLADEHGMVHGLLSIDEIKSFKDTVGKHEWTTEYWEESMGHYKSGAKKGQKKAKVSKHSRSRTFNELPVDKHSIDYGASDSDWALGLYYYLLPLAEATGVMEVMFELDVPRMMVLAEYELTGWHVSRDRLFALKQVAMKALKGDPNASTDAGIKGLESLLNDELIEIVPHAEVVYDEELGRENVIVPAGEYPMGEGRKKGERSKAPISLFIKEGKPFNWASPGHRQWLFYHILKFPLEGVQRGDSGLPTTNAETVDRFIENYDGDSPFMKILKEKSKYDKINSTYVNGMLPFCRTDTDRLHTALNLVNTWRLSSKKPNLQNIPRPDNDPMGIRSVFVAPFLPPSGEIILPDKRILLADKEKTEQLFAGGEIITPDKLNDFTAKTWHFIVKQKLSGHVFYIGADYAQIELKVLAWFAREMGMINTLASGGDLHAWVAHRVFKLACLLEEVKELFKSHRYRAKKVNFGIVFGMTEFGLAKDPAMGMTVAQAKKFIADYMATFPGVREYADEMISFARKNGYVTTMFNHRRPVPHINDSNQWVRQKAENICMNTPIQGSAADIIALAMVNIRKEQHRCPALSMHMQIHDELQGQAPVEHAVEAAMFIQEVMERPIDGFSDIMPIVAEPAIGATWDTALDLKWDEHGNPYVKPKKVKKEAMDVTYEMIEPYMHMYELAGIKVA